MFWKFDNGLVVNGNTFDKSTYECVDAEFGIGELCIPKFKLIICDPPYGEIVDEDWDKEVDYPKWFRHCAEVTDDNATICLWGGVGKKGNRPFIEFACTVEKMFPEWEIYNWITWRKVRAYGTKNKYLFTREECLILVKGNPVFNIPLLDKRRPYQGYNPKYPAKSEFYRRTDVWTDITELLKDKIHPTQKPDKLYEILINTHSNENDLVYDPCAGSLTTMRACRNTNRRFCCIERKREYIDEAFLTGGRKKNGIRPGDSARALKPA